jgi:hypothetical protein
MKEHIASETEFVSALKWKDEEAPVQLNSLEIPDLSHSTMSNKTFTHTTSETIRRDLLIWAHYKTQSQSLYHILVNHIQDCVSAAHLFT